MSTQTLADGKLLVERGDGGIVTVTLNNPEKRNPMSLAIFEAIHATMDACDADGDVRCIVFRGAGGKAFGAGADIAEFRDKRGTKEQAIAYAQLSNPAIHAVQHCRHPTVALIEGLCVGGGFGLAAVCDLRVCGTSSRFGVPVKRLGLVESPEELTPLVRKFGASAMLEILLVGDLMGAERALALGLVNKVVPDAEVEAAAYDWARKIAEGAPLSARWHKQFIYRLLDPAPLTDAERDEGYDCFDTEDFKAGFTAFLEKRTPEFTGR